MKEIRTRIAPSPTGFAHVGTAYGALFNHAFARGEGGRFILRLEDTDVKRHVEKAEEAIYGGLEWLGILWDEGPDKGGPFSPYKQSQRLEIYQEKAQELIEKGLAFKDEGAIKFRAPGKDVEWNDLIRGSIIFPASEVKDFVIVKSDGFPVYHFAVVVDDHLMEISHVIRGEEHISNTPRQIALYNAFGWDIPQFAHFPTLRGFDRKKLSKRRDPVDLRLYREEGYLPEALVNYLCLLGWSHPEEKEIFTLEEFIKHFSLERVRKAGPVFDVKKLDWINGEYVRKLDDEMLTKYLIKYVAAEVSEDLLKKIAPLIRERITKFSEVQELIEFFWQEPSIDKNLFEDPDAVRHIAAGGVAIGQVEEWTLENVNKKLDEQIGKEGFNKGKFYMSLRLALSGKRITPPINESIVILGQDQVLYRLEQTEEVLAPAPADVQ